MAAEASVARLIISQGHLGSFQQGNIGDAYILTVSNVGTAPTTGAVTVNDTLPAGLTATAISGTGWSCTLISQFPFPWAVPLSCTRSDSLAAGASYPAITLTVSVAYDAPVCSQVADGLTFQPGDILLSLGDGHVQWRHHDWTLAELRPSVTDGQAKGMGFDTCGNLFVTHWFGTGFTGNNVVRFDRNGNITGLFGSGYNCNPSSIVFDNGGNAYVGHADCSGQIVKLDSAGNRIAQYAVAVENRGTSHILLAPDQCTMYYTSEGPNLKRFDVCSNTQMSNFNSAPLPDPGGAHQFSLLPGGGMLVANFEVIARLDASGNLVRTYNAPAGNHCWLGMALAPDGTSFWASNWCESSVTRFNLSTGNVIESHVADDRGFMVKQIVVPASSPSPVPPNTATVTGGGELPPPTPPPPPPPGPGTPPTLTVTKNVKPSPDQSKFNLQIGGTSYVNGNLSAAGVGNGGSTGAIALSPGTYTVGETLASGDPILGSSPHIGFYTNNVSCFRNASTTPFLSQNFNTSLISFVQPDTVSLVGVTLNDGDHVVCAITNTLKARMPVHKLVNGVEQTAGSGILEWTFNLYDWNGRSATPTNYNQYPGGYRVSQNLPPAIDPWAIGTFSLCEMGQAQAPNDQPGPVFTNTPGPYTGILPGWTQIWTFTVNGVAQTLNVYDPDVTLGNPTKGIRCINFTLNPGETDVFTINNVQTTTTEPPPPPPITPPPPSPTCGRFTGGGSIFRSGSRDLRVTHGFELHCNLADTPNNLEVNFGPGPSQQFHLTALTTVSCSMDSSIPGPGMPLAPFNTIAGTGTGKFEGVAGSTVSFTITDQGEPGVNDTFKITILGGDGSTVLDVEEATNLTFGNHQAHSCQGNP